MTSLQGRTDCLCSARWSWRWMYCSRTHTGCWPYPCLCIRPLAPARHRACPCRRVVRRARSSTVANAASRAGSPAILRWMSQINRPSQVAQVSPSESPVMCLSSRNPVMRRAGNPCYLLPSWHYVPQASLKPVLSIRPASFSGSCSGSRLLSGELLNRMSGRASGGLGRIAIPHVGRICWKWTTTVWRSEPFA